jgi:hypothetical protein
MTHIAENLSPLCELLRRWAAKERGSSGNGSRLTASALVLSGPLASTHKIQAIRITAGGSVRKTDRQMNFLLTHAGSDARQPRPTAMCRAPRSFQTLSFASLDDMWAGSAITICFLRLNGVWIRQTSMWCREVWHPMQLHGNETVAWKTDFISPLPQHRHFPSVFAETREPRAVPVYGIVSSESLAMGSSGPNC